jgi:hypothetical protein
MFLPVLVPVLILALIYGSSFFYGSNEAQANVAAFYPTNCLGGWKHVDNIAGQPEVRADNDINYSDENSASTQNSNAQVFCGGFAGEIPTTAKHQKVTVNFSWYIGDNVESRESKDEIKEPQMEVISEVASPPVETPPQEAAPEASEVEEIIPEPEPAVEASTEEPAGEPTAFNFYNHFFNVAHAQEETPGPTSVAEDETVVEEILVVPEPEVEIISEPEPIDVVPVVAEPQATPTAEKEPVIEVNPSEGAYFEVLYTLNGQDWHTLGFVSRIANDVQIEMPIDLFATVADLEKVQIALHTVERFDSVPKIYLDALWLEVTYDDIGGGELVPPGERPGDVIFSETTYQDQKVVVVLRNVELMTLSNVLSASDLSTTSATSTAGDQREESTTTTSVVTDVASTIALSSGENLTDFISTSTLASIINSTGVLVELWLYASTSDSWSRIADDSVISRNPQVKFESGSVFWVDKSNASVWRYLPSSGGYDALSLSEGEVSKLQFRDEAGELKELEFSLSTSTIMFDKIKTAKPPSL